MENLVLVFGKVLVNRYTIWYLIGRDHTVVYRASIECRQVAVTREVGNFIDNILVVVD